MFHEEHLSEDQRGRLDAYGELVRRWSPRAGLVSERDLPTFEQRHVRDSLRVVPLLHTLPAGDAIDVGSGAGLPGIPLAIAEPSRLWRLLEPRTKRAAFLEEAVRVLGLSAEVVTMTAEQAARIDRYAGAHVIAVSRALAPPAKAFALLEPFVGPDGIRAVFTGPQTDIPEQAEVWAEGVAIMRRPPPPTRG